MSVDIEASIKAAAMHNKEAVAKVAAAAHPSYWATITAQEAWDRHGVVVSGYRVVIDPSDWVRTGIEADVDTEPPPINPKKIGIEADVDTEPPPINRKKNGGKKVTFV